MNACPGCARELPEQPFPFCPWCARPLDAGPSSGQRKTVSVLFADLVDSTALGSTVDPEVLRGLLGRYWQGARAVVEAHGGTVEKFIGDAVFGVFGVPTAHEDDALRAVRAAQGLLRAVEEVAATSAGPRGVTLAARVGVSTGEVLAGDGLDTLMSGDAGNLAARLQAAASPGRVLISAETWRLVREDVVAHRLEPLVVKGKAEPVTAYELVSVTPAGTAARRRRRYSGPMLARDRQMMLAQGLFEAAVEGSTCVALTVVGEPGVGKTRLVDELLAASAQEATVLTGRCLPYGEGSSLAPLADVVARLREPAALSWRDILGDEPFADRVAEGLSALTDGSAMLSVGEIGWAFRRLVESSARRRPVVLVVDDLQWADPSLLELLAELPEKLRTTPVVLIVMARPELGARAWAPGGPNTCTITLQPLPAAACRDLVGHMLGPQADDGLKQQVADAAEGIPLFVEETVAMMVDDGLLVPATGSGYVVASGVESIPVPGTVRALLAARLDQLPAAERSVIEAASVIGKVFYPDAVAALVPTDVDVGAAIDGLLRADLVASAETDLPGFEAFAFNHLLVADAAYQVQAKSSRAQRHVDVARWLQNRASAPAVDAIVASHLERAAGYQQELGTVDPALRDEVVDALVSVGWRQLQMDDASAAARLAQRAEALSGWRAVEPLLLRAEAASMTGDEPRAALLERAIDLAAEQDDRDLLWQARIEREHVRAVAASENVLDESFALAADALAALTDEHMALAEAYRLRAWLHNYECRYRMGGEDALRALEHAVQVAEGSRRIGELVSLAVVLPCLYGDATLTETETAMRDMHDRLGEDLREEDLRFYRMWLPLWAGRIEDGLAVVLDHVDLCLDQNASIMASVLLGGMVGWCRLWQGEWSACADALARAIELRERPEERGVLSTQHAELALMLALLGRADEASHPLSVSRELSQPGDVVNEIYWPAVEGRLAASAGRADESDEHFRVALALAEATEMLEARALIWLTHSCSREVLGDPSGALSSAEAALELMSRKEFPTPIAFLRDRVEMLRSGASGR